MRGILAHYAASHTPLSAILSHGGCYYYVYFIA